MIDPTPPPTACPPRRRSRRRSALVASAAVLASAAALASIRSQVAGDPESTPPPAVAERDGRAARADWARATYQAQCANCHGVEGAGGAGLVALAALPWPGGGACDLVREAIVDGVPGTKMAAFGPKFDEGQVDALLAHVRAFAPGATRPMPAALDARLRAAGFDPERTIGPAPPIDVEGLDGARASLADTAGKVTILVFWGTTCGPCIEEMPDLERLADAYQGRDAVVMPAATDETDATKVRRSIQGVITHLPVYFSRDPDLQLDYDIHHLPAAALIDRGGRLVGLARNRTDWGSPAFRDLLDFVLKTDPPG